MRKISVAEDIVPIGRFKTHTAELLRQMKTTRRPLVITQNGEAAAVVLTPEEFDELGYQGLVRAKIAAGLASAESEPALPSSEVRKRVKAKLAQRAREG
jgi:prevent-host-death family protein